MSDTLDRRFVAHAMLGVWSITEDVQEHLLPAHSVVVTKMEGARMPYTAQHKRETRNRILRSARKLFNRKGFAEVTIDEIMSAAGLTRGGFYKHFTSKDDLYSESIFQFTCKDPPEAWQRKHVDLCAKGQTLARMIMDAYLSREHFEDLDGSCPTLGLATDVSRNSEAVKRAFRKVLDDMLSVFVANLPGPRARERGIALVSVCVGAMVVARAVDDQALGDAFRKSARKHVLANSGWGA